MFKFHIIIQNKLLFIGLIIYKFIIDYSYYFITKNINISNMYNFNWDIYHYLIGWFFTICIYTILNYKKNLSIYFILFFIYTVYIIPNITYFSMSNQSIIFLMYLIIPYVFITLCIINLKIPIYKKVIDKRYIIFALLFIVICVIVNLIYKSNSEFIHDFRSIYTFRAKYSEGSFFTIFNYLESWTFKIFSLFLLAYSIKNNRKILLFIVPIIVILFIFSGYKMIILSSVLIFFLFFIINKKNNVLYLLISLSILISTVILYTIYSNNIMPASLLIRRFLIMPAVLNFIYLDFFSDNEYIYWSNGILKNLYVYPYDMKVGYLIGSHLGLRNMYANAGLIPMGYAHAGFLGIMLYTFLVVILLNIINGLFNNSSSSFIKISAIIIPIYTFFVSSDLLTTILSHGLFIAMVLLYFYNEEEIKRS